MDETTDKGRRVDRFRGALLGTMVGDAMGAAVEGFPREVIVSRLGRVTEMLDSRRGRGCYTDDTQMMIALAQVLGAGGGQLDQDRLADAFAADFDWRRGYGLNAAHILSSIRDGLAWREAVRLHGYPGGSFANGAAMRVAPVALAFFGDAAAVAVASDLQAEVTGHTHPIGRFGSRLQAMAVRRAVRRGLAGEPFDGVAFAEEMLGAGPAEFDAALAWIRRHPSAEADDAERALGTSLKASCSVCAALWAFVRRPDSAEEAIIEAVNLGGDTDTIGAMTGAMAGGFHGAAALGEEWTSALENGPKGRDHVLDLADRLAERV